MNKFQTQLQLFKLSHKDWNTNSRHLNKEKSCPYTNSFLKMLKSTLALILKDGKIKFNNKKESLDLLMS